MQVELTSDGNPQVELKLEGVVQDAGQLKSSFNISAGKTGTSANPQDTTLVINMADDELEVRGFGQPITHKLAADIALKYIKSSEDAWELIDGIDLGRITTIAAIKQHSGFEALKKMLHPASHIVSGVFGKETILQMIAQKDCEGIRYIIGEMATTKLDEQGQPTTVVQTTVVLTPVKQIISENATKAESEPLVGWEAYTDSENPFPTPPPDTEVHKSSLTRAELYKKMKQKIRPEVPLKVQVLFGQY